MRNIEKLAQYVLKHGSESIIVHTIPSTSNWIICQKIDKDKWTVVLCNPMGSVMHNVGSITNQEHINLWMELVKMEIEKRAELIRGAK